MCSKNFNIIIITENLVKIALDKRIIQELFKAQNPYFDKNLEACWNFGILIKKISVSEGLITSKKKEERIVYTVEKNTN